MQHKCKVTVIDKNVSRITSSSTWKIRFPARARFIISEIRLFLNGMAAKTHSGWPETARSVQKPGTVSAAIFIRHCRAAALCGAGRRMNA